jgi:hypothetical protein
VDGTPRRETGADLKDKNPHLAKVRVAGSNPVLRSIVAGQGAVFQPSCSRFSCPGCVRDAFFFGIPVGDRGDDVAAVVVHSLVGRRSGTRVVEQLEQ